MSKFPLKPVWKPELLAPARNLERLKVAVTYGADAIYVGGQKYGLRARADNFSEAELIHGVEFAHQHQARVYVTLNAFLHDEDFEGLDPYCKFLESIQVDAVIVSDPGVIRAVQQSSNLKVHLSTQASCLNSAAGQLWRQVGVDRLILGRELSIAEAGQIREHSGVEVEMFVHGAMCMAYSGHCTISNFTAGRDSNRGGCIQSCRFPYQIQAQGTATSATIPETTFMSSKDLWGIAQVADFFKHQICSLKIEGRMKSAFYVAMTCRAYRQAIDACAQGQLTAEVLSQIAADLGSIPHRDYTSGSLESPAAQDSVYKQFETQSTGTHDYLGIVLETTPEEIILQIFDLVKLGDRLEVIPAVGAPISWQVHQLCSIRGDYRDTMRQDSIVRLPKPEQLSDIQPLNVVRKAAVPEKVG
ncbi:MAG: U32 family peptidase [Oscillatoriales cyanobacterium RM2_1_1]|nr:U32 family peptidase [Oscillatoriales cyanobacterium SM2_3_0]NJO47901.1 U32 family peptidase [Oscillatoriales cyanobacterium RM2_1_1]